MAIYHCSVKIISRSKGRSSVAASAYRSGSKLHNEWDGMTHDYTNKQDILYSEIMLCENAPNNFSNREVLWNAVEKIEKSSKAQLAREYEIALPKELHQDEQINLVKNYVKDNFVDNGMCADIAIHSKEGNPHAHIMLTTRPFKENGEWGGKSKKEYILDENGKKQYDKKKQTYKCRTIKSTNWDNKEFLQSCRENWAVKINRELERKGLVERVDHRSYEEQGIEKIPMKKMGVAAHHMELRGIQTDRGNINREIQKDNTKIEEINATIKSIQKDNTEL